MHLDAGFRVHVDRVAGEFRGGLRNLEKRFPRALRLPRAQFEFGAGEADSRASAIVLTGLLEPMPRADEIVTATQLLCEFAVEVRERGAPFAIAAPDDLRRDLDCASPIPFALIHLQQMFQRDPVRCAAALDEIAQQLFGAIEQTGAEVIAGEFELGERPVLGRQVRTREQVLMDPDRLVEFAATAHHRGKSQMRIDAGFVGRQRVD